jgi:hypothetical protein
VPTAAATLRHHLAAARRRGEPFEDAWPSARDAALATAANKIERARWATVLAETVTSWRDAYNDRSPSAADRAACELHHMATAA